MSLNNHQPGQALENAKIEEEKPEKPIVKIENSLVNSQKEKFYKVLRELFGEGSIDSHLKKFTITVVEKVIKGSFRELPPDEREAWFKRINKIIVYKLGGHAELGWKHEYIEEQKRKKEDKKSIVVRNSDLTDNEVEETVADYLDSLRLGDFTSD